MNLEQADRWLADKLYAVDSHEVTYSRGPQSQVIKVVFGSTSVDVLDESGMKTVGKVLDLQIRAAEMSVFSPAVPQRGDRVTKANGEVHEVLPLGDTESRAIDTAGYVFRVHTKRVS